MEASRKYNLRNPAVKRILQEMKEMQQDTSQEFAAEALEDNIFEWQFVICGPVGTEFEGGLYDGRIILPSEYPFKPPSFVMLTPSGRFEVGKKICLSISERHPEHWQPSWSMRTALMALVAFLPTKGKGAIGSLDFPEEERRKLAQNSRSFIPNFGNEERQHVANRIHEVALKREKEWKSRQNKTGSSDECTLEGEVETIKSAADTRSPQPSSHRSTCSEPAAKPITSCEDSISNDCSALNNTSISSAEMPTNHQMHTSNEMDAVGDKEWAWSAAMWAVGLVILAILTKKVLVRAGMDIWYFTG